MNMLSKFIFVLLLVTVFVGLGVYSGVVPFQAMQCSDVFCNDYEMICCGIQLTEERPNIHIDQLSDYTMCPVYADHCEYLVESGVQYVKGSTNCRAFQDPVFYWVTRYTCDDDKIYTGTGSYVYAQRGETFHAYKNGYENLGGGYYYISLKVYEEQLNWCGDSPCAVDASGNLLGVPVQGASGCTFVTNADVYDKNKNLIHNAVEGQDYQITVPAGECYWSKKGRHVCGNTCETCSATSDCIAGHMGVYTYAGKQYGAECNGGKVELYDCITYGTEPTDDDLTQFADEGSMTFNYGKRCEATIILPAQCCPWTDSCGANAFCDSATLTCKSSGEVECTYDWECGQAVSCSYDNNNPVIKQKKCIDNKCQSIIQQQVDCCYDTDCPGGYYCGNDYKCYEEVTPTLPCPYQCCENLEGFRDKPCTNDLICCPDHQCKESCEGAECTTNADCNDDNICTKDTCTQTIFGSQCVNTPIKDAKNGCCPLIFGFIPDVVCILESLFYGLVGVLVFLMFGAVVFFIILVAFILIRRKFK